jgi:hypothetical protein
MAILVWALLTATCKPAPQITTTSLPPAVEGSPYYFQIQATGCPCTWSETGLPPELELTATGVIMGTPTQSGKFTIVITVESR